MNATKTLTFATANLFNFLKPPDAFYEFSNIYEQQEWQAKCQWTKSQITQLNADIIGLQEVFSIEATQQLLVESGFPYFVTVDTPKSESDYIYSRPVVALASKYPIIHAEAVKPLDEWAKAYQIELPQFSRKPIHAVIKVPTIGEVSVYVCHLKSQRATEPAMQGETSQLLGQWLSSQLRGWEAVMLKLYMDKQYQKSPMPTALLGDMNQPLTSDITGLLTQQTDDEGEALVLTDSWNAYKDSDTFPARVATHYHFSKGNVLDYVLLSQEFQPDSQRSIAEVISYLVQDQHLINPIYQKDKQASDHAFVAVGTQFLV
ncbi:endonuclease/exonuclease/phosphatase family protein [Vibrio ouci]|uniref:Endonuclease/exonuclease/phosphatase family protein n=1 Tax=Vibrio ouci TaxID=2499078 RepID=A0A4Y8WJF8_9VIBR|nr:endonuclease/exonuclease/phosphatase family protein [Vibrio ouci]TFH92418.1 endonuclease/exonuclease/phosphatase family protein [Vibrio ouci]